MGFLDRALERIQEAAGVAVVSPETLRIAEATAMELSATRKDLELLGWTALDAVSKGGSRDAPAQTRRQMARSAWAIWQTDPMAGAATDLLNDFTFSRGVPKPRARDPQVQEVIDASWDDVDNKAALTTYAAQVALGVDLTQQSNIFLAVFDDGQDGKVKLTVMPHDRVIDVVRDKNNPMRILYYVIQSVEQEWDFEANALKTVSANGATSGRGGTTKTGDPNSGGKIMYYEHWLNPRMLREQKIAFQTPPSDRLAKGTIYHISTNRGSEMAFGVPTMQRTIRWYSGYNEVVAARVDMAKAAASMIMKRKVTGTPRQVERLASQALSRNSELGAAAVAADGRAAVPPANASIVNENENVVHEALKLDSGAGNAVQDTQMIRAQVSAGTGWPQHYLGDASASTIAGNTALELPVLKHVEARQELFENLFRAFVDRVIERAVEVGKLDKAPDAALGSGIAVADDTVTEAADAEDEATTERDLSYEFSMPSPMRRMMIDLVTAIGNVARTFDPNNTNLELSKTLLTIALGEAFEMQDPAEAVERIFPKGYVDPAVAAAQEQAQAQPSPDGEVQNSKGEGAPTGGDGVDQEGNPYGAQMKGGGVQEGELESFAAAMLDDPVFRDAWLASRELVAGD